MAYASDLVGLCLRQTGDRYIFGHEVDLGDDDPEAFDCAELVQWACARLDLSPPMPDGSWIQARHCNDHDLLIPTGEGLETQGALLFSFKGDPFSGPRPDSAHVAVSLGNGNTIEARGSKWGVGSWTAVQGRHWTHAGRVPGLRYAAPPEAPRAVSQGPHWPGRYLTQPPIMPGDDVRIWQQRMAVHGYTLELDGEYGPESAEVCSEFQGVRGLLVDSIVGPDTWNAAWLDPSH